MSNLMRVVFTKKAVQTNARKTVHVLRHNKVLNNALTLTTELANY